jgi:hypothetical protein
VGGNDIHSNGENAFLENNSVYRWMEVILVIWF